MLNTKKYNSLLCPTPFDKGMAYTMHVLSVGLWTFKLTDKSQDIWSSKFVDALLVAKKSSILILES